MNVPKEVTIQGRVTLEGKPAPGVITYLPHRLWWPVGDDFMATLGGEIELNTAENSNFMFKVTGNVSYTLIGPFGTRVVDIGLDDFYELHELVREQHNE